MFEKEVVLLKIPAKLTFAEAKDGVLSRRVRLGTTFATDINNHPPDLLLPNPNLIARSAAANALLRVPPFLSELIM